jgi:hypothetical protein
MYKKVLQDREKGVIKQKDSYKLLEQASGYLTTYVENLDSQLDSRLVRTFYDVFIAILCFRHTSMGLLLSELGAYILGAQQAPAGTKRISNLLRSAKWTSDDIEKIHLSRSSAAVQSLKTAGKWVFALWDDSVLEKPESWFSEGLCAVASSKAKRLTKIKRGYYKPPQGKNNRICVPGFEWSNVMVCAWNERPFLGLMRWWTTRGEFKDSRDNVFYCMLKTFCQHVNERLIHIFDRGYASLDTLERLTKFKQDLILRWKSNLLLTPLAIKMDNKKRKKGKNKPNDPNNPNNPNNRHNDNQPKTTNTWRIAQSLRSMHKRIVWDKERKQTRSVAITYTPVKHPEIEEQTFYLIVARDTNNKGQSPMYLLTSINIDSIGMAWMVFFAYMQRWHIEQAFRFNKSELAMQSPRLWFWENRLKLLAIVALIYDFLLSLLINQFDHTMKIINKWCPRTGKRHQLAMMPLYRLRTACAVLINIILYFENSG